MDNKQDITITINVNMTRLDADTLAEFLHEMIHNIMKLDAVISYTIDAEGENQLPFMIGED